MKGKLALQTKTWSKTGIL